MRVDLGSGRCAYGRQVLGPNVEFYDRLGATVETVDLLDVVASPVAFTIWVMKSAFKRRGGWEQLDVVPLTDEERAVVTLRAKQDPVSRALSIYRSDPVLARSVRGLRLLRSARTWRSPRSGVLTTWKTGSGTTSTDARTSGWNPSD